MVKRTNTVSGITFISYAQKIWMPINVKVFEGKKTKSLNRIAEFSKVIYVWGRRTSKTKGLNRIAEFSKVIYVWGRRTSKTKDLSRIAEFSYVIYVWGRRTNKTKGLNRIAETAILWWRRFDLCSVSKSFFFFCSRKNHCLP